jgi:hypothetical protein
VGLVTTGNETQDLYEGVVRLRSDALDLLESVSHHALARESEYAPVLSRIQSVGNQLGTVEALLGSGPRRPSSGPKVPCRDSTSRA